eukprot:g7527.t1
MFKSKESEADKLMKKAMNFCKPSVWELRLKPDWNSAIPLYEQAANTYKSANNLTKARVAYERAAECQDHSGSSWHAGKMFEKAAETAKEQNDFEQIASLYIQASQSFFESGRAQTASEALYKGAKALQDHQPEKATELYTLALDALEQDDRFSIGPDLYRSVVSHEIRQENFKQAIQVLLKYASICEERGLHMSVARSYLGAIVISLYIEDVHEALAIFNDSSSIDTFLKSIEYTAAAELLNRYRGASSADEIKSFIKDGLAFQSLDTTVGRLALRLPTGNLGELSAGLQESSLTDEVEDLT